MQFENYLKAMVKDFSDSIKKLIENFDIWMRLILCSNSVKNVFKKKPTLSALAGGAKTNCFNLFSVN